MTDELTWKDPKVHNMRHNTAPSDAVYIGRGSRWGNPYSHLPRSSALYICETRERAIEMFRYHVLPTLDVTPLRGKHLVCWCKPEACHGDLLLEAANKELP
jgi:hypothetical protein